MSNALAIASVTRLLKDLLNDTLVNGDISGDIGTDVIVTSLPPDRVLERMNADRAHGGSRLACRRGSEWPGGRRA